GKVLRKLVEVIATSGIIRAAMTASIRADITQTLIAESQHLIFPHRAPGPKTAGKHHGRTHSPLPIIQADMIAGFNERHNTHLQSYGIEMDGSLGENSREVTRRQSPKSPRRSILREGKRRWWEKQI